MWIEIEKSNGDIETIQAQLIRRKQKYYNVVTQGERHRIHGRRRIANAETVELNEVFTDVSGIQYRAGWSKLSNLWILSKK